jgi:hypothetical protein
VLTEIKSRRKESIMKKRLVILASVFLVMAVLACSDGGNGGGEGTVTLTIFNESSETICFVYISPSDSDEWGEDALGDGNLIEPGDTYTFDVVVGTYDLMAENCDGEVLGVQEGVDMSESKEWTFSDQ